MRRPLANWSLRKPAGRSSACLSRYSLTRTAEALADEFRPSGIAAHGADVAAVAVREDLLVARRPGGLR